MRNGKDFLRPLREREGLGVFLIIFYFFGVLWPLAHREQQLSVGLATTRERLGLVGRYERFKKRHPDLDLRRDRSEGTDSLSALKCLRGALVASGLEIRDIRFRGSVGEPRAAAYESTSWDCSLEGPESSWLRFLTQVGSLGFFARVVQFEMRALPRQEGVLAGSLVLQTIQPLRQPLISAQADDLRRILEQSHRTSASGISTATSSRRIFKPSPEQEVRRVPAAGQDEEDVPRQLSLVGIVDNGAPKAIVEDKKDGRTYSLSVGEMIGGWRVSAIDGRQLILEKGGRRSFLAL